MLFYIAAVLSPRWVATAAAAGPSALVIWGIALIALFVPLAFCVIELSSRYPEEGVSTSGANALSAISPAF